MIGFRADDPCAWYEPVRHEQRGNDVTPPEYDWDEANIEHIADHDVSPEEVEAALRDPRRIPAPAYSTETERRFAAVGATAEGRILFVVYTQRKGMVRVVTAREAGDRYRRRYRRGRR